VTSAISLHPRATNLDLPSYKVGYLAILKKLSELGVDEVRGHLLFAVSDSEYGSRFRLAGTRRPHLDDRQSAKALKDMPATEFEAALDKIDTRYVEIWQKEAGLRTYGGAVATRWSPASPKARVST